MCRFLVSTKHFPADLLHRYRFSRLLKLTTRASLQVYKGSDEILLSKLILEPTHSILKQSFDSRLRLVCLLQIRTFFQLRFNSIQPNSNGSNAMQFIPERCTLAF